MPPIGLTGEGMLECFCGLQAEWMRRVMKRESKALRQRTLLNGAFKTGKTIYCRLVRGALCISERYILSQERQVFGCKSSDLRSVFKKVWHTSLNVI